MSTALEQEIQAYETLIVDTQTIIDDPLIDNETLEQAKQTIAAAQQHLHDAQSKVQEPTLNKGERRFRTSNNKAVVVNECGYGEPDLANPDVNAIPLTEPVPVPLADATQGIVMTPTEVAISEQISGFNLPSGLIEPTLTTVDDYNAVVAMGKTLDIDAIETAQLWSQLQAKGFGVEYTQIGLFALRLLVENRYMHKTLAKLGSDLMCSQAKITALHQPQKPPEVKPKGGAHKPRK
jgi:hypothetical protein